MVWAIAAVATFVPFGVPSLAAEVSWDFGRRYPREVDWRKGKSLGQIIEREGLRHSLIADYQPAFCPAIAVYYPISCEKGHWIEVQPPVDQADQLAVSSKVYILPLTATNPELAMLSRNGWIQMHGGAERDSIVTFADSIPADSAAKLAAKWISDNSTWLALHAIPNVIAITAARSHDDTLRMQRERAGRLELAALLDASALESSNRQSAKAMQRVARGFGVIASLLGDDVSLDYLSDHQLTLLKDDFAKVADIPPGDSAKMLQRSDTLLDHLFGIDATTFAERPAGDPFPWLELLKR